MRKLLIISAVLFCLGGIVNLTFANGLSVPGVPSIGQSDVAMSCSGWSMTTGVYFPTGCSGGGGSAAYVFKNATSTSDSGSSSITISGLNLGSGSIFVIIGLNDGQANTAGVSVDGTALSLITSYTGNALYNWGEAVTVTGSDTITITPTAGWSGAEVDVFTYAATNPSSNTPKETNNNAGSAISISCSVGDFVFAMTASGSNFSASAQTPNAHTVGTNGYIADWTANSTGCSGGTFTATNGGFNGEWIASWH